MREDGLAGLQGLRGSPWAPKLAGRIQAMVAEVLEPREYGQDRRAFDSSPKLLFLLREFNAWTSTTSLLGTNLTQTRLAPTLCSHTHTPHFHAVLVWGKLYRGFGMMKEVFTFQKYKQPQR